MGGVKTALAVWDVLKGVLPGLWARVRGRVIGRLPLVPSERRCRWQEVTRRGRAETLVQAEFHVTNTRRTPVALVAARLSDPPTRGAVSVEHPGAEEQRYAGLPAGAYGLAHATFYVHPPIGIPGKDITADVVFVDNLNCQHRCRRVVFTPYPAQREPAAATAEVPAMTRWAYLVLLLPPTVPLSERDLEAAKRQALGAIAPAVTPRRWFFRRFALGTDPHGADPRGFRLYVEIGRDEALPLLRLRVAATASAVLPVQVLHAADWDGLFLREYGDSDAQAAMRDFCAEAAPAAIIDGHDPVFIAQRHMDLGRAPAAGIRHWWMWLRDGRLVEDEGHLWQDAVAAYQAGAPPPC
jgi:hypothetical protein